MFNIYATLYICKLIVGLTTYCKFNFSKLKNLQKYKYLTFFKVIGLGLVPKLSSTYIMITDGY